MKKYYAIPPLEMVIEADILEKLLREAYENTRERWHLDLLENIQRKGLVLYAPRGTFEVK